MEERRAGVTTQNREGALERKRQSAKSQGNLFASAPIKPKDEATNTKGDVCTSPRLRAVRPQGTDYRIQGSLARDSILADIVVMQPTGRRQLVT